MTRATLPPVDSCELAAELPDHVPGLLRYASTLTADHNLAEDLVQETVSRALERAGGFRGDASVSTWLHRILHNLAVDHFRRSREDPVADVTEIAEQLWRDDAYTVDNDAVVARAAQRDDLFEALSHLPMIYRSVVVLHDAEEMTVREIADIQQVGLAAAKQRLRRGRMMLVSQLAAGPDGPKSRPGVPLRCWEARRHISDYLDDDLAPTSRRRVELHLHGCPTCPPLYAALVGTTSALKSTSRDPDTVIPTALADRLKRARASAKEPRVDAYGSE